MLIYPHDIGSREEMLRLRAAPPPWYPENPKRWVVTDLECFILSGPYGHGEWDTLAFLYNTWPERQSRVVFTRDGQQEEILWPRRVALAHMTPSGDTVLWDVKVVFKPSVWLKSI